MDTEKGIGDKNQLHGQSQRKRESKNASFHSAVFLLYVFSIIESFCSLERARLGISLSFSYLIGFALADTILLEHRHEWKESGSLLGKNIRDWDGGNDIFTTNDRNCPIAFVPRILRQRLRMSILFYHPHPIYSSHVDSFLAKKDLSRLMHSYLVSRQQISLNQTSEREECKQIL